MTAAGGRSSTPQQPEPHRPLHAHPVEATSHTATPLGAIGIGVNGVSIFNMSDGMSYSTTTRPSTARPGPALEPRRLRRRGRHLRPRPCHQPGSGEYTTTSAPPPSAPNSATTSLHGTSATSQRSERRHHHRRPGNTNKYDDISTSATTRRSSLVFDGYPIYGPYGYSDGTNATAHRPDDQQLPASQHHRPQQPPRLRREGSSATPWLSTPMAIPAQRHRAPAGRGHGVPVALHRLPVRAGSARSTRTTAAYQTRSIRTHLRLLRLAQSTATATGFPYTLAASTAASSTDLIMKA